MLLASNFSTDFGWYADLQALKKPALKLLKYTSYCPIKNNLDSLTSEKKNILKLAWIIYALDLY